MNAHDDLATLRSALQRRDEHERRGAWQSPTQEQLALARVETELSRLRREVEIDAEDHVIAERHNLKRAEAAEARCARLQQALKELRAKVVPSLIAVKGHLETPYVDDERWTPWSRFVEPCLYRFDEVLNEALAGPDTPADSHYRERPIEEDFYLDPRGEWVYRWSDERRVLTVREGK